MGAEAAEGHVRGGPTKAGVVSALSGDLPCLRCGYNLRGLSVLGTCPECGTPARATLLSVVDPLAGEIRPIPHPWVVGWGLVLWAAGAIGAAACVWTIRTVDATATLLGQPMKVSWAPVGAAVGIGLSGVGALAIVRPHAGIRRRGLVMAAAGVAAYAPLTWVVWHILGEVDAGSVNPFLDMNHADAVRTRWRLVAEVLVLVILLGLRPNARLLAARSMLMREGRVDRQTMLAMVAAVLVGMAGDGLHLLSAEFRGTVAVGAELGGTLLIAVSSLLLTLGLTGVLVDVWRIRGVILDPPPTLRELVDRPLPPTDGGAAT
jgi:hypothetical protein